eukprot:TRINITY_DN16719_c0_g5_i3.p1 TRINITY_DN16719_c0_g5~~TRINITY_DN16719_c0_g5_i3.p1  ORF type:complete len:916 (-),score=213.83 TRINITY_DN16719_c0_g5_i3:49-2796(-)
MGGGGSVQQSTDEADPQDAEQEEPPSAYEEPTAVCATGSLHRLAHERLRKLQELDEATKVPFILVELTGEDHGKGEIEVCGKDEYGVYAALDEFFRNEWDCEKLDHGDLSENTKIPFCKAQYAWPGYQEVGDEGMNNMGRSVMRLIDFMSGKLSWTLAVVNSGNVGRTGKVREQQIIFKAPHPMNLVAPHLLIELRSAGYIEICADLEDQHAGVLEHLDAYFVEHFGATRQDGHEVFCDLYYKAGDDVFRGVSGGSDCNFGLLATRVCDEVVQMPGWSLVATSCGNCGVEGEHSEQQLVFRRDEHPLGGSSYIMVILNVSGNIEVNGRECRGILRRLQHFLKRSWHCSLLSESEEGGTRSIKFSWEPQQDLLTANAAIVSFFEMQGFEIQVTSQYMIKELGEMCREQQLLFRPGKTEVGTIEPHLVVELYAGEGSEDLYKDPDEPTQVLANSYLRLVAVQDPEGSEAIDRARDGLDEFVLNYLGGAKESEDKYALNVFMCRGFYENNLAQWTMRVCDYLVDRLGWSFIVCSLCNMGEYGQIRKQQLIFRFDGDKRDVPIAAIDLSTLDLEDCAATSPPDYWKSEAVLGREKIQEVVTCDDAELEALQQLCDATYRRVLTRDRDPDEDAPDGEEMPYRLEVVHAFRSEHAWLHHRYQQLPRVVAGLTADGEEEEETAPFAVKCPDLDGWALAGRLAPGEAYLFHGTNPSSAMSILKTGFALRHAGSATGTMYGAGVYMAECSSKSDEYGRDDGGHTYPGLLALLVCRCYVGKPYVVTKAGDHVDVAREGGYDCVCGDRETSVGTYREFVFFDEAQIYPEYTVIYRRQYAADAVPRSMRTPAKGTTGRFWQVRGDIFGFRGWKNVPPEINTLLITAASRGRSSVAISMTGNVYNWDMREKVVIDDEGKSSPLRPPMR